MLKSMGRPELYFMDLRPVNWGMVVIASHQIAEQISRSSKHFPYSVTKSPTMHNGFYKLIGNKSLLTLEVCIASSPPRFVTFFTLSFALGSICACLSCVWT
jgi:hypothetical protein